MTHADQEYGERFVRLALAIDVHLPGYVDAYFGPEEWRAQAKQQGKVPLSALTRQTSQLAADISREEGMDLQRREYLAQHVTAMQMSLRLLGGEQVSLSDEVEAIYGLRPDWKEEANFEEARTLLDEVLPSGGSLRERSIAWETPLKSRLKK